MGIDAGVFTLVKPLAMLFVAALSVLSIGAASQKVLLSGNGEKNSPPTFYKDLLPILQSKCQNCHRTGQPAPMPLVTYDETRPWAGKIAAAVEMRMMPPWFADPRYGHFANDPSLSADQVASIVAWANAGAPAGDERDAPAARTWSEGWNIPQPDVVVKMPKAVRIPANGEVEYTYEIAPLHFTEDT